MGSIIDIFLDDTPKTSVTIKYKQGCDFLSIRYKSNAELLNQLSSFFKKRELLIENESKETNGKRQFEQNDAVCIHVGDDVYEDFINSFESNCREKLFEFAQKYRFSKTNDEETDYSIDSIIELLQLRQFLTRYFHVRSQKKYESKCYWISI